MNLNCFLLLTEKVVQIQLLLRYNEIIKCEKISVCKIFHLLFLFILVPIRFRFGSIRYQANEITDFPTTRANDEILNLKVEVSKFPICLHLLNFSLNSCLNVTKARDHLTHCACEAMLVFQNLTMAPISFSPILLVTLCLVLLFTAIQGIFHLHFKPISITFFESFNIRSSNHC